MSNLFIEKIRYVLLRLKCGFANEIYYINSPQILPPPLSKKDEEEMVVRLRAGDISARDKLVEHNLRLVV